VTRVLSYPILCLALAGLACANPEEPIEPGDRAREGAQAGPMANPTAGAEAEATLAALLTRANTTLARRGSPYIVAEAEWISLGQTGPGQVFASHHGNRRLPFQFVPDDPRRVGDGPGNAITYLVDRSDGATVSGLSPGHTEAAVDRAMETWGKVRCGATLLKVADDGSDPDFLDGIFGFGGIGTPRAQITHAGWVEGVLPEGILAITFTVGFRDEQGLYSDIDGDGRWDCAFREIYYSDDWPWGIDAGYPGIDVESVALHEAGHGLSQGHFGRQFRTPRSELIRSAPRAVMNAGYTGLGQDLRGTDMAGYCGVWSSWDP
jgi:hypothetical protein